MNASGRAESGLVPASGWVGRRLCHLLLVTGVLGCSARPESPARAPEGGAPPSPPAPAVNAPTILDLDELEALEHDLAVSEARLDEQLGRERAAAEPAPDAAETAAQPPGTKPKAQPPKATAPRDSAETSAPARVPSAASGRLGSPCDLGCRALQSMRRAQERICAITGPVPRCQGAIERVAAA